MGVNHSKPSRIRNKPAPAPTAGTKTKTDISGESEKPHPNFGRSMRKHFSFDENWINLNHGSFGTTPTAIRASHQRLQLQSEQKPDEFMRYTYPTLLDGARSAVAELVHAPVEELVLVPNATTAVNTVLRGVGFEPGDVVVYFDTLYPACGLALQYVAECTGIVGVCVDVEFPASNERLISAFRAAIEGCGGKARLALFDTITSLPGLRMPFEELTAVCREYGVLSLIDGAHGIGQIPLDLAKLDADFFVSNLHKWLFVPRGCALLHVPLRNQRLVRSSLPTSHGFMPMVGPGMPALVGGNPVPVAAGGKSAFVSMFEFVGTIDNSAYLSVPAAIRWREEVCGGEEAVMEYCSRIGKEGALVIAGRLGTEVMTREGGEECALWNIGLPLFTVGSGRGKGMGERAVMVDEKDSRRVTGFLTRTMVAEYHTFVTVMENYFGQWWVRVSGQIYLELSDFEFAAGMLEELVKRVAAGEYNS